MPPFAGIFDIYIISHSPQKVTLTIKKFSAFIYIYSNNFSDIAHLFRNNISSKNEAISSAMAKSEKAWGKILDRFLEKMDKVIDSQG